MELRIASDGVGVGIAAAALGAEAIRAAQAAYGQATLVLATGASQFRTLEKLVAAPGIDWSKVTAFHLDEYVGLPVTHPASFRRYLTERFMTPLGGVAEFVPIDGDAADPEREAQRLGHLIRDRRIDVCLAGIGENCHLAFNDPPADFDTDAPYLVVTLDEACRRQQLGEGWFPDLDTVPRRAITMSIKQIMKSRAIVLSVPDARKAEAVKHAAEAEVNPLYPASILQRHSRATLILDPPAAALLRRN